MKYLENKVSQLLIVGIKFYQLTLSSFLGGRCRFVPTCSEYSKQSIQLHGAKKGLLLSFNRICKCHPFGPHGYDPVQNMEKK